jgi:PAS domain S-box-containing protein
MGSADESRDRAPDTVLALVRSDRMLRQAQRVARMACWAWNRATRHLEWSDGLTEMFGVDAAEPDVDVFLSQVHGEDLERLRQVGGRVARGENVEPWDFRIVRAHDGRVRWVRMATEAIRDDAGAVTGLLGTLIDVTEYAEAQEALRESEARWRSIAVNPFDFVVLVDRDGVFQWVNHTWPGVREEDLIGKASILDFTEEGTRPAVRAALDRVFDEGLPAHYETYSPSLDAWFSSAVGPLVRDGKTVLASVLARDITAARRAESEVRKLEAELVQSRRLEAVGRLAGGIAHDFNNVLTAILGNAELVARDVPSGSGAAASIDAIRAAAQRASGLTRQLLAFARRQIVSPRIVNPNPLVLSIAELFRPLLGEAIRLELDLASDVFHVRIDVGQFEQLLMNLVVNARDAMSDGGTLRIRTENVVVGHDVRFPPEVTPGEYVAISVTDTGEGIPRELQPHVFEPFFTTKPAGRGTGLGLATCHGIVKQSGGHISLESEPGVGTRVVAFLPRPQSAADPEPVRAEAPRGGSETILVVEDEAMVRRIAVGNLRELGYDVLEADGAEAAMRIATRHASVIHLLFTDVVLSDRRGTELASRMTLVHPETRVLYTSGYTEDAVVTAGVESSRLSFLHKPYSAAQLGAAVRSVLDAPSSSAEGARLGSGGP